MGISTYGSPAPFSVLPSLRLMSNTCKVWSRGVNNIISEIIEWKPAPSPPKSGILMCIWWIGMEGCKNATVFRFFSQARSEYSFSESCSLHGHVDDRNGILHFSLLLKRIFERDDENERTKGQTSCLCPTVLLVCDFNQKLF